MKKFIIATVALISAAGPAYAMTYYLQSQWVEGGSRFCKYNNGTVLNVGAHICPMSIQG